MKYRLIDHTSNPVTKAYLVDLYEMSNDGVDTIYVCAPTGGIGITIVLSGETYIQREGNWERTSDITVYGLIRKSQSIKMVGNFREITIGFQPHVLQLLLNERLSDLVVDAATDLSELLQPTVVEQLAEALHGATTDEQILQATASFISSTLNPSKEDTRVAEAHRLITRGNMYNIERLSERLNISTVGLRNLFREKVGVSPKELVQLSRIKKTLYQRIEDVGSLTTIGYESDYFDQSHFIKDFKKTIGVSPKQYYKNKELTSDFYNFGRWRLGSFEKT